MNKTITEDHAGQRLDNYLFSRLKGVPKSRIYKAIRGGEVRINKGRAKAHTRLQAEDVVRIPPIRVAETPSSPPAYRLIKLLEPNIIYEDNKLIILNKPAGIAVHGGSGIPQGVIEALRKRDNHSEQYELIHRLDKGTSGCLMIAKKRSKLRELQAELREGNIKKHYLALLKGKIKRPFTVNQPLSKFELKSGERRVKVDPNGKASKTIFTPLCQYKDCTLVKIELLTGRMHQIRVHAAHAGHPIIGDEKYGCDMPGIKRMMLHAAELHVKEMALCSIPQDWPLPPTVLSPQSS